MTARYNFVLPDSAADSVNSSADSRPPPAGIPRAMRVSATRFALQKIDDVIRGRFAFDIGRQRKNDFGNFFPIDAIHQFFNAQIFGSDMIERRNLAAERMISAAKCTGLFQRKNVSRLFCDAEQISRSRRVGADFADFAGGKESAQIAGMNRLTRVRNGACNLLAVDRRVRAPSRVQSAPRNADRRPAFAAVAQLNPGSPPDIPSFSTRPQIYSTGHCVNCRSSGSSRRK